jgi:hypothetical protein
MAMRLANKLMASDFRIKSFIALRKNGLAIWRKEKEE